jgi:hypothetical protein
MSRAKQTAIALAIIVGLIAINHVLFAWVFGASYLGWYIANGAQIGFLSSLLGLVWGSIDRNPGLISANPRVYCAAVGHVACLPLNALRTGLGVRGDARNAAALLDGVVTLIIVPLLALALLAWMVVIAPLQYVAFLVCGASARTAMRSSKRAIARFEAGFLETRDIGRNEKIPEGWWDTSLGQKPFAFTSLVQGLLFYVWKLVAS